MRHIDLMSWPRREHFKVFTGWGYPHFSVCANVDITAFYPATKQRGVSFTVALVYLLARAANTIPEFRYRIRGEGAVEHEVVRPGMTVLTEGDLFGFCTFEYAADFASFAPKAAARIAYMQEHPTIENDPDEDDLLYMSALPWVSFTSVMHPLDLDNMDSIPRLTWGKYFSEGDTQKMPLSVQGHHALMDGIHVGWFFERVQDYLDYPETVLGEA
ncbi:MAG: chloramphenicol acetyltransferase [Chloroflexi bacterium]|nr:chloramphenicol acetyltransferase [Chloroflexota bacterium]